MNKSVIIELQSGASFYTRRAWAKVFESIGYKVITYMVEDNISPFKLIQEHGVPSLFLGTTYNLNRAWVKIIKEYTDMKVVLYCSGWGELCNNIDLNEYPIQVVSDNEKKFVEVIKDRISACHIHIPDSWVNKYIGGWTDNLGIPIFGMMLGADTFVYSKAVKKEKYIADISMVAGHWKYKSETLDKYITRFCREYWKDYDVKIYGRGTWDIPQYLGSLADGEDANVFNSTTICPNISEKHSYIFPDIIERIYKTPIAGGFSISDNVDLSEIGLKGIVPQFSTYDDFCDLINYYLKNIDEREFLLKQQKKVIWENHTYHHRIYKLLKFIGLKEDAEKCLRNLLEI